MNRSARIAFTATALALLTGATEIKTPDGAANLTPVESISLSLKFITTGPMPDGVIRTSDGKIGIIFKNKATFALIDENGDQEKAVALDCQAMSNLQEIFLSNVVLAQNMPRKSAEVPALGTFNASYTLVQISEGQKSLGCPRRMV
jgi:hypothetical protein